jgi:hypothetical protein
LIFMEGGWGSVEVLKGEFEGARPKGLASECLFVCFLTV